MQNNPELMLHALNGGAQGILVARVNSATDARAVVDAYLQCECTSRSDSLERLTDREREVMILVAEGHTNQQIAEMLHVSPKTVDGHRTSLMSKLELHSRTEVVKFALRRQLIEL